VGILIARPALPAPLLPALLLLAAVGCGGPPGAGDPSGARRLVTLAPSITETVFALDLGDRVVGIDEYSTWPPETAALPTLGGLFDPNLEAIAALEPDLAILLPSQRDLGGRLAGLGIEVLEVPSDTLADVEAAAAVIAERCGVPAAGSGLVARLRRELAPAPLVDAPPTALVVGRQPGQLATVLVAAPGTYLDELLARLGAVNVFTDVAQPYPQVGLESFVGRRPRALVELQGESLSEAQRQRLRADWLAAPGLELAEECVSVIDGSEVLTPGPRLVEVYQRLRAALEACP
jgi:iron complex transport system substrate-binding protein